MWCWNYGFNEATVILWKSDKQVSNVKVVWKSQGDFLLKYHGFYNKYTP